MPKIDFVIPVRNRENERIQRCVNNLQSDITGKIVVVDYGSDEPIDVKNCEVIYVKTKNLWNKSHALNIGIKSLKNNGSVFIGTVDCDMIIGTEFLEKCKTYLKKEGNGCFIFTRAVRRIEGDLIDWELKKEQYIRLSTKWLENRLPNVHEAVGGIQIFPRDWIFEIRGYDENLIYWGGIDNDIYERAIRTGLVVVDLNEVIFHQEHKNIKEQNLESEQEAQIAYQERLKRRAYLLSKWHADINIGPEIWGVKNRPQQNEINITYQDGNKKTESTIRSD